MTDTRRSSPSFALGGLVNDPQTNTYTFPPWGWTCFHCGENFRTIGTARDHFGMDQSYDPACRIKLGQERLLVMALRKAERELERYRAEDTDLHREIHSMSSSHAQALIREEERGYAKGLADGRKGVDGLLHGMAAANMALKAAQESLGSRVRLQHYVAEARKALENAAGAFHSYAPEPELPDGLFMHKGAVSFTCRSCGNVAPWDGEVADFQNGHRNNLCGGSPRCCP